MGSGDGTDEPDWRHNVLRDRLGSAATTASGALDTLAASTGNPLTSLASAIDDAWKAPGSRARSNLLDDVRGAGTGIRSAFSTMHSDLVHEHDGEPVRIDVKAQPQLTWKTSAAGVDGRVYTANQRPW